MCKPTFSEADVCVNAFFTLLLKPDPALLEVIFGSFAANRQPFF